MKFDRILQQQPITGYDGRQTDAADGVSHAPIELVTGELLVHSTPVVYAPS